MCRAVGPEEQDWKPLFCSIAVKNLLSTFIFKSVYLYFDTQIQKVSFH